jgi:hypothetical protein
MENKIIQARFRSSFCQLKYGREIEGAWRKINKKFSEEFIKVFHLADKIT